MVTSFAFCCLGASRPRSKCFGELNAELAGLRPADGADDRADADDVDGQRLAGRDRFVAFDQGAHGRDIAQPDLGCHAVDRGDGAAHQAMARFADALKAVGLDA